jgi:hypothetical protein
MAEVVVPALISLAVSYIATSLTAEDPETPLIDDKPSTVSKRGSYIPRVLGRRLVGAVYGWAGNRVVRFESQSGGKGQTSNAGQQTVYYEDAIHFLTINGSDEAIFRIRVNGENVLNTPISRSTSPSGSQFTLTGEDFSATMRVYWGHEDDPISLDMADTSRLGVATIFPNVVRVELYNVRLGGFAQWPAMEYEIKVNPKFDYLPSIPVETEAGVGPVPGTTPQGIIEVGDSVSENSAFVKIVDVSGAQAALFSTNGFAGIEGQPLPANNRVFTVFSAVHNPAEIIRFATPTGPFESGLTSSIISVPWTVSAAISSAPGKAPFTTTIRHRLGNSSSPNSFLQLALSSVAAFTNFRPGQRLIFFLRNSAYLTSGLVRIAFSRPLLPSADHHYVDFSLGFGGQISLANSNNGATGTIAVVPAVTGFGSSQEWYRVEVSYSAGSGYTPSTTSDARLISISTSLPTDHIDIAYVGGEYLRNDPIVSFTGTTTITFVEPANALTPGVGTVRPYQTGGEDASTGLNVAHVIAEMLFSPRPWGSGIPTDSDISLLALETVGNVIAAEKIRTNLILQNGVSYQAVIQSLLVDYGLMWVWNPRVGKYEFRAIRDTDPIIEIPSKAVQDPLPEHSISTSARQIDRIAYLFSDRDRNYKDNGIPFKDDLLRSFRRTSKFREERLLSVTDYDSAQRIANRRSSLEIAPAGVFRHSIIREGRAYPVSTRFIIEGEGDFIFRILGVTYDINTSIVVYESVLDSYGFTPSFSPALQRQSLVGSIPEVQPDAAFRIFEMPASWTGRPELTFGVVRLRSSSIVREAAVYTSKDDVEYWIVGVSAPNATGGLLTVAVDDVDPNPTITFASEGPDVTSILRNILDSERDAGTQWALINDEIFKCSGYTITDDGIVTLTGVTRLSYGVMLSHSIGDRVFVFDPRRVTTFRDESIVDTETQYLKVLPLGKGGLTLASITPYSKVTDASKLGV